MGQLYIIKHCYKFCECLMSTCPYYSLRNTYFVLIRPPGTLVPKAFCFSRDVFLTRHRISELRRPIVAKLCTVISICVNFLTQVQKLGGPPLKNFTPAKFSVDFTQLPTFIANISGTRQDIQNRKDTQPRAIPPAFSQTSPVNFGPVSTE